MGVFAIKVFFFFFFATGVEATGGVAGVPARVGVGFARGRCRPLSDDLPSTIAFSSVGESFEYKANSSSGSFINDAIRNAFLRCRFWFAFCSAVAASLFDHMDFKKSATGNFWPSPETSLVSLPGCCLVSF